MAGIGLMLAFCLVAPGIDLAAKAASAHASPLQIALARFGVQTALLLPLAAALGRLRLPDRRAAGAHALRGALLALATWLIVTALARMPIADVFAIFFVEPLILTLLSPWLLGERVGWRRLAACGAGFLGALLVIRPGLDAFGWIALAPLGAALAFALYLVLTRRQAQGTDGVSMQLWAGAAGVATLAALMAAGAGRAGFAYAALPDPTLWLLAAAGACSAASHLLIVAAFARAPASVLAPFQYLELPVLALAGWALFAEAPAPTTLAGMGVIVGAGLYVFARERRLSAGS